MSASWILTSDQFATCNISAMLVRHGMALAWQVSKRLALAVQGGARHGMEIQTGQFAGTV